MNFETKWFTVVMILVVRVRETWFRDFQ